MTEIETKFDVSPDFVMPTFTSSALGSAEDDAHAPDPAIDTVAVASTYFDTEDDRLLRFTISLRHREGQADTGWQLKVPSGEDRAELHWPSIVDHSAMTDGVVLPHELDQILAPFLGGRSVAPSIRLDVSRTRYRFCDAKGRLLVELADDEVRAFPLRAEVRAPRWRELELELGGEGKRRMLKSLGAELLAAGAYPSTSRSKLARARVGIGNEGLGGARASAGAVLMDYMSGQARTIFGGHFAIHAGRPSAVHQTRVATRRLRSTLRTFSECFDADQAANFEAELKWFAATLGEVRDREVMLTRLSGAVDELPDELVMGPVGEQIKTRLTDELTRAQQVLITEMGGARYSALLGEILRWRDDPPFTAAAGRPAKTLNDSVRKVQKKLSRRLTTATRFDGTDEDLHSARKVSKQVRYAAEAAEDAPETVAASSDLQDLLGEFHDSVVAAQVLRRLAEVASTEAEDTFTYGVLVAQLRQNAERDRQQLRDTN
ncbi:CHAD domain-containing protein [Frankineae bacterium MT45]|nr:CHAD domain-containing protein [Frankineae bacterium MT45]